MNRRALVVDDETVSRAIVASFLKRLGFLVLEASDGTEALHLLEQRGPCDLAVVDWQMPRMNGIDFLKHTSLDPACEGMKAIMISASQEMHAGTAIQAGADHYLSKPFSYWHFRAVLRSLELLPEEKAKNAGMP